MATQPNPVETKMSRIGIAALVTMAFAARLVLDPKGGLKQMAKNKEKFEDDNDERVVMARELTRWAGILLGALGGCIYALSKSPLTLQGDVQESTRDVFKALGAGLFLDGLVVKWLGFLRSDVFTMADSFGGGIVDMSLGLFFLKGM